MHKGVSSLLDSEVGDLTDTAVPHRRSVGGCEIAVAAGDVLAFPYDVHALETAFDGFDTTRLFESRLTFAYRHALEAQVAALV